jgi:hypothetical protein
MAAEPPETSFHITVTTGTYCSKMRFWMPNVLFCAALVSVRTVSGQAAASPPADCATPYYKHVVNPELPTRSGALVLGVLDPRRIARSTTMARHRDNLDDSVITVTVVLVGEDVPDSLRRAITRNGQQMLLARERIVPCPPYWDSAEILRSRFVDVPVWGREVALVVQLQSDRVGDSLSVIGILPSYGPVGWPYWHGEARGSRQQLPQRSVGARHWMQRVMSRARAFEVDAAPNTAITAARAFTRWAQKYPDSMALRPYPTLAQRAARVLERDSLIRMPLRFDGSWRGTVTYENRQPVPITFTALTRHDEDGVPMVSTTPRRRGGATFPVETRTLSLALGARWPLCGRRFKDEAERASVTCEGSWITGEFRFSVAPDVAAADSMVYAVALDFGWQTDTAYLTTLRVAGEELAFDLIMQQAENVRHLPDSLQLANLPGRCVLHHNTRTLRCRQLAAFDATGVIALTEIEHTAEPPTDAHRLPIGPKGRARRAGVAPPVVARPPR